MTDEWMEVIPPKKGQDNTPFWEPDEDDELLGVYYKLDTNVGNNASNVYTIQRADGSLIKVWGSVVLDNRMQYVTFGETIKIIYLGKPKGKRYKDYKVFHSGTKLDVPPPVINE